MKQQHRKNAQDMHVEKKRHKTGYQKDETKERQRNKN